MTKEREQLKANEFSRLGVWYMLALAAVASVIITGQFLIQNHLRDQQSDSRVVNVAGKQRMLSQKIVKTILLLQAESVDVERKKLVQELKKSLRLWEISQDGLINGNDSLLLPGKNSPVIAALFKDAARHFQPIDQNANAIAANYDANKTQEVRSQVQVILREEPFFLENMEGIVFQFDREAKEKVTVLSRLEYLLLVISILVIGAEVLFIFRPTAENVNKTVNRLLRSEEDLKKMSNEIRDLYASLEKSYSQIANINQPIENPRLYAKADRGGSVTFISQTFTSLTGKEAKDNLSVAELFSELKNPNDWMDDVIDTVSEGKIWTGELRFRNTLQETCWALVNVIPVFNQKGEVEELVVMGSDMTKRKRAEQTIHHKMQAEVDKRINQQKYRSVLILEGQEEERKRIAMEVHDGIGQMLTSLKFQFESIDLKKIDTASKKLTEMGDLIRQIIKEVRKVTFNLRPMVLGDYGLQAALNVFVKEMQKLIEIDIKFQCEQEINRLPQKVENNVFRIIQEAINNSIKYSGARQIEVILKQNALNVVAEVKDDGKGFDIKLTEARSINVESGRGFFNMYERSEYINGKLEVITKPGEGTTVRLTVPTQIVAPVETVL